MKPNEMRKSNAALVLYSIKRGNDTALKISKDTGLSLVTIGEVTKSLIEKEIICATTAKQNSLGRRSLHFSFSEKYFSAYIEEKEFSFSIIFINAQGEAVGRYEYVKRKDLCFTKNIMEIIRIFTENELFPFCLQVFVICPESHYEIFPSFFTFTTREELIVSSDSNDDDIILYEIFNKFVLSIYGHVYFPATGIKTIEKVIKPNEYRRIGKNFYQDIFTALKNHTINKLFEYI